MPGDRCQVVLYTPKHHVTMWSLGTAGVRKVIDLWAERTETLGARSDVDYVLCFENRGAEVGATIAHPHGQIYAYDQRAPPPGRCCLPVVGLRRRTPASGWWPSVTGGPPPCRVPRRIRSP